MKSYVPIELDYGEGKLHRFMIFNNLISDIDSSGKKKKKTHIKMTGE